MSKEPWRTGSSKVKARQQDVKGQLSQSWRDPGGVMEWKLKDVNPRDLSPEADEWTWIKLFLAIRGVVFWAVLDSDYPTAAHYSFFLGILSNLCLSFTWHVSKWRQYNSTNNKPIEFFFVQQNSNGKSTHVLQSKSWHQSSRWFGPDENHWLHGSYSPESFLTRLHLYPPERKEAE